MIVPPTTSRPFIAFLDGKILHNGVPCRVVFTPATIEVGCTTITKEAAEFIGKEYATYLRNPAEKVVQG